MGNRATLEVISSNYTGNTTPCYIYLHWQGSPETVIELVKGAAPNMRKSDVSYSTARLIAHICSKVDGGLSVGVSPPTREWKNEFDNGHYVIDVSNGHITHNNDTGYDEVIAKAIEFGDF